MKKFVLTLASIAMSVAMVSAQDLESATNLYNSAAEKLNAGNKTEALAAFKTALEAGSALGEDGSEIVANCKNVIPNLALSIAKDVLKDKDYDGAITKINEAVAIAKEYGDADIVSEGESLLPQVNSMKYLMVGMDAYKTKDFAAAIDNMGKVLAIDSTNANASKIIGASYLQEAVASLKGGKFQDAIDHAAASAKYTDNAQAYLIAGQAATKLKDNNQAIEYYTKYLAAAPTAKNADGIAFTVAALYQQAGNKANAIKYYKMVPATSQYAAQAKQLVESLSK